MSKDLWNDEPFRDGAPVLENGLWKEQEIYIPAPENTLPRRNSQPAMQKPQPAAQEDYTSFYENSEFTISEDEDEDFTDALTDANLRLEQGRLYKEILDHDLFEGVDADPRAVKAVQKQIRTFARESMELMLGMRSTVISEPSGSKFRHPLPFNDLEVEVLKKIASAASKGATEQVEEDEEQPVNKPEVKKKGFNSIGPSKSKQHNRPIQKRPEPIQRFSQPKPEVIDPFEPDYKPLDKPLHEMTAVEKEERNRQASERQRNRKAALPVNREPMPSYETQEMLAYNQVSRASTPGKNNLSALILANLKNSGKI